MAQPFRAGLVLDAIAIGKDHVKRIENINLNCNNKTTS